VLLKVEGWFNVAPFEPDDALYEALSFATEYPGTIDLLLQRVVFLIRRKLADKYGTRRGLEVGDVVVLGESTLAVEQTGWRPVRINPHLVWHDGEPMYLVPDDDWPVAD